MKVEFSSFYFISLKKGWLWSLSCVRVNLLRVKNSLKTSFYIFYYLFLLIITFCYNHFKLYNLILSK